MRIPVNDLTLAQPRVVLFHWTPPPKKSSRRPDKLNLLLIPPLNRYLRAADGIAWALLFLGIVAIVSSIIILFYANTVGPFLDGPQATADTYITQVYLLALWIVAAIAFRRRHWWAWDLSGAYVFVFWSILIYLINAQIFSNNPTDSTTSRAIVITFMTIFVGLPLAATTAVLFHPSVVYAFPYPLPPSTRIAAAYSGLSTLASFARLFSREPERLLGFPLPPWAFILFTATLLLAYAYSTFGLYQHRRPAFLVALSVTVLQAALALTGLLRPALSSVPASTLSPTVFGAINLLTALAMLILLLRPSRSAIS